VWGVGGGSDDIHVYIVHHSDVIAK